jgi:predicted lipoprotein with Yx(FWY)xxD motif
MSRAPITGTAVGQRAHRQRSRFLRVFAVIVVASAALVNLALASSVTPTVSSTKNATLNKTIVVDAHGRSVYALSPETVHHLLCKPRACFEFWPPVTVRSRAVKLQAGRGVQGHLALLRRSDGKLQVTLSGIPLYRFAGDSAKGQANGEGIKSFGGTWHAVSAKGSRAVTPATGPSSPSTPTTTTTTPAPSPPAPGHGY